MKFERNTETVDVRGNRIVMAELSALEMQQVMATDDEHEQAMQLVLLSLTERPSGGADEVQSWPTSVTNELLATAMKLNGLTGTSGN